MATYLVERTTGSPGDNLCVMRRNVSEDFIDASDCLKCVFDGGLAHTCRRRKGACFPGTYYVAAEGAPLTKEEMP